MVKKLVHRLNVEAYRLTKDSIVSLNAVDKKGYAGDWVVTYPDGKMVILTHETLQDEFHSQEGENDSHFTEVLHTVTQEDIDNNPDGGLVLGENILIPMEEEAAEVVKKEKAEKPKKEEKPKVEKVKTEKGKSALKAVVTEGDNKPADDKQIPATVLPADAKPEDQKSAD